MSEALERFKATHPDIDDGTPTMSLPRAKERSASSDTTPTQPTPLKRTRGVSDPRSSGSASDEELHSNLAEAGPQLPQPGRKSEEDHSAHCPAPNASSAVETETAPRIASLDGAVETGGTQPKSSVLVNDDDELGDINALIASLEADDKEDPPTSATTDKETEEPSPVPDDWLRTDINVGLTTHEAAARRHACGYNEMNEEKKHILKKWLAYFRGPIQYTMIVSKLSQFWSVPQADCSVLKRYTAHRNTCRCFTTLGGSDSHFRSHYSEHCGCWLARRTCQLRCQCIEQNNGNNVSGPQGWEVPRSESEIDRTRRHSESRGGIKS